MHECNEEKIRFIQELAKTDGKLESTINLNISHMKVIELDPIQWFNYNDIPKKLKFTNTGYTATLSAQWHTERPYLCGGPLASKYVFSQIHFHWGENDMSGSEHHVDGRRMPMELHSVHFNSDYKSQEIALHKDDGIIILVYLFQLQSAPNPLFDEIVNALPFIQVAQSSVRLTPFLITNIIRCFHRDYFTYWGSIRIRNYMSSILWLISREPLLISAEQITEFRLLHDKRKMPILTNCRPLRDKSDRNVFYVCPSEPRYATLLSAPRK